MCFLIYINMEQINEITNYEKAKESIYKWRDTNKQKYLIYTSAYNLNRYNNLDPEKKIEKIERAKLHVKARRERIKQEKILSGNTPKRGRPRLHVLEV